MIYFRKSKKTKRWKWWQKKKLRAITDSFRIVNARIIEIPELEK